MDATHRLQILEDIEAIRTLKARYCQACDDEHNPDKLRVLFTQDAVWEASGVGRAEGREEIAAFLGAIGTSGTIRNSAHNVMNPVIEVNGNSAEGDWRLIMLYTGRYPDDTLHFSRIIGWYKEQYERVGGQWLIANLYCEVEESAPYQLAPEAAFD
ncbi:MAG: nuclear transport factor 2 family protein [Pseudomonadota bacterium]